MNNVISIDTVTGRTFNARIVEKGDGYGVKNRIIHDKEDALIEFYDATFAGKRFGELGQFVSRYYVYTIDAMDVGVGLDLHSDIPEWILDPVAMRTVKAWLTEYLENDKGVHALSAEDMDEDGTPKAGNRIWGN